MSIVSYQYEQHTKIPLQTNWGLLQRSGLSINFTLFLKPNLPLWLPWDHLLEFGQPTLGLTGMAPKIVQTFAQRNVQPLKKVDIRDNGVFDREGDKGSRPGAFAGAAQNPLCCTAPHTPNSPNAQAAP